MNLKKQMLICEFIIIIIILNWQKLDSLGPMQQKIK